MSHYPLKIFHHLMFDAKFLMAYIGCMPVNPECTKVMMKVVHPGLRSGLASALEDVLHVDVPDIKVDYGKWGVPELSEKQKEYICNDVVYLNELYQKLVTVMSNRQWELYRAAIDAVQKKVLLDVSGYDDLLDYKQNSAAEGAAKRKWWVDRLFKN